MKAATGVECVADDVAGIIARLPMTMPGRHYTTRRVVGEVIDRESRESLEFMIEAGLIEVVDQEPLQLNLPASLKSKLSATDVSLLVLALSLKSSCGGVYVATDDYALQEAALLLGLKPLPVRYKGARVAGGKR